MTTTSRPPAILAKHLAALRKFAATFPETREDFPWEHSAFKVRGKTFVFLYADAEQLSLSTKLRESGEMALGLPFAEPTGYGLGKSGWVSARFGPKEAVPIDLLKAWIDESYRAIAPKKLTSARETEAGGRVARPSGASPRKTPDKTPTRRKSGARTPKRTAR